LPIDQQYATSLTDLASRTLPLLLSFYEKNRPNLILYYSYAFAGLILAKRLGIPAIRMTCHLIFDDDSLRNAAVPIEFRTTMLDSRKTWGDFLLNHGIPLSDTVVNREEPTVYFYLKDFQLSQHVGDRNCLYAARCVAEQTFSGTWKSHRVDSRRTVLVSASTSNDEGPGYYRMCMEALSELGWHMVLAIGDNNEAALLAPLPPHCEIVQGIPRFMLKPYVDYFICHGGIITVMEAMYHGIPLIMLSQGHPHIELEAQNFQNHGLGVHLRKAETTVDTLRECVKRIANDTAVHAKVREMQRMIKRSPGGEDVANWIEQHLENRT
jgi:MGT family glycosyltransferase